MDHGHYPIPRASLPHNQFLRDRCPSLRCFSHCAASHKQVIQAHPALIARSSMGRRRVCLLQPPLPPEGHIMHCQSSIYRAVLAGTFVLLSGILASSVQPADKAPAMPAPPAATIPGNAIASGASEDSLQACLARIPKDATTGQRLMAEQSCRRDDGDRKPFQATLGR